MRTEETEETEEQQMATLLRSGGYWRWREAGTVGGSERRRHGDRVRQLYIKLILFNIQHQQHKSHSIRWSTENKK